MSEEEKDSRLEKSVKLATEVAKALPVYQDTVQPAAQEIGKSLAMVTKTVNIALAPIKAIIWGYDQIEEFVTKRVSEKLENTPSEDITTPPIEVAGPAIEALRFAGHNEDLRELYANLLATSMDKSTCQNAHPGFVEILKNLSGDEAILLKAFISQSAYPVIDIKLKENDKNKGYVILHSNFCHLHKELKINSEVSISTYIDNLCRLGILERPPFTYMTTPNTYEPLENDPELDEIKNMTIVNPEKGNIEFDRRIIKLTAFGRQFIDSVVSEKEI